MAYPPAYYQEHAPEALWQLLHDYPFALLCITAEGRITATHLPVLLITPEHGGAAPYGSLEAHVAINNPAGAALRAGAEVLVVASGPHAYVSPAWYPDSRTVPTWNYLSAQARGRAEALPAERVLPHLEALVTRFEQPDAGYIPAGSQPWTLLGTSADTENPSHVDPATVQQLMRGIFAFRIDIAELTGVRKLNQNKSARDIASVIRHLQAIGTDQTRAVAAAMAALPPKE